MATAKTRAPVIHENQLATRVPNTPRKGERNVIAATRLMPFSARREELVARAHSATTMIARPRGICQAGRGSVIHRGVESMMMPRMTLSQSGVRQAPGFCGAEVVS